MNTDLNQLLTAVSDPEAALLPSTVEALGEEYPFFILPSVMLLVKEGDAIAPELRQKLMERIALNAPDPSTLFMLTSPRGEQWRDFYPADEKPEVTTDDAITKFLETYGHSSPREEALLERLIFNPVPPDYAAMLEKEKPTSSTNEERKADEQDALIDAFLTQQQQSVATIETVPAQPGDEPERVPLAEPVAVERPAPSVKAPEDSSLSESLAKIYIRQKRYDKAFEIIHTLSLNNPKKSAYFADQLRFLRKLILNKSQK